MGIEGVGRGGGGREGERYRELERSRGGREGDNLTKSENVVRRDTSNRERRLDVIRLRAALCLNLKLTLTYKMFG